MLQFNIDLFSQMLKVLTILRRHISTVAVAEYIILLSSMLKVEFFLEIVFGLIYPKKGVSGLKQKK